jgi:hypothetical protein
MIDFPTKSSFIKTTMIDNNIGGFIAVVKIFDSTFNYLYSPINENSDLNFKFIGYNNSNEPTNSNESNIDLHSKGSVYYNGTCVFDYNNKNNVEQYVGDIVNNLVIVYVNFKNLNIENFLL